MLQANVTPLVISQQFRCHARTIECLKKRFWQIRTMSDCVPSGRHPQGGYSNFFHIRRLGPSIYCSPPKNIRIFKHPPKISQFCTLTLKKDPKTHRNDPQTSQFCDDPKKNIHKNLHTQKNIHFSQNPPPPKIEIQNFEPQKMGRAYVCVKISEYPPGTSPCNDVTSRWINRRSQLFNQFCPVTVDS